MEKKETITRDSSRTAQKLWKWRLLHSSKLKSSLRASYIAGATFVAFFGWGWRCVFGERCRREGTSPFLQMRASCLLEDVKTVTVSQLIPRLLRPTWNAHFQTHLRVKCPITTVVRALKQLLSFWISFAQRLTPLLRISSDFPFWLVCAKIFVDNKKNISKVIFVTWL